MIKSDKIFDIKDKINSLEYFLDNSDLGDVVMKSSKILFVLDRLSEGLIFKTNKLNAYSNTDKILKSVDLNIVIKSKMTDYLSIIFKMETLKDRMKTLEEVKVSKYVSDFIENV